MLDAPLILALLAPSFQQVTEMLHSFGAIMTRPAMTLVNSLLMLVRKANVSAFYPTLHISTVQVNGFLFAYLASYIFR